MLLAPDSIEVKLLQLLRLQGQLDLSTWPYISAKTILPFEKWFLNEYHSLFQSLSVEQVQSYLRRLEILGLVKRNSRFKFCLTSDGSYWAYNLIEYTKQVELNELQNLIGPEKFINENSTHATVLDVGCGGGASLIAIENKYGYIGKNLILIGLDIEYRNLTFAKEYARSFCGQKAHSQQITFVQGDAIMLPFHSESFHIVFLKETLYLLNRDAFLIEAYRVLQPKGRLIIVTPSWVYFIKAGFHSLYHRRFLSASLAFFCILNGAWLRLTGKQWQIKNRLCYGDTAGSLRAALREAGFYVLQCNYHKGPFSVCPIVAIAEKSC